MLLNILYNNSLPKNYRFNKRYNKNKRSSWSYFGLLTGRKARKGRLNE